jgi:hypothetical protein
VARYYSERGEDVEIENIAFNDGLSAQGWTIIRP